jgi:multidrug efflux pump subunit AcrA (membrane-fusion protein)
MMSTKTIKHCLNCLLALFIISAAACNRATVTSEAEDIAVVITPVTITHVTYQPVTETIELFAVTAFLNKNIVRSATTGTVESISISIGENIKRDQLLYIIRTRESSAISNSLKGDSTLSFNGRINIIASKDGVISSVSHQNGDFVQEGDELAVISEQNSLVFILDTPFEFVKYVENSKRCKIHLSDNQIINGTIGGKLPEMDTQAQTVKYVIRPVFDGHLPANLNAVVRIVKSSRDKASILPKSAVLGNETQTEFWIMKLINDSTAIKVPVTKGFENNDEVEITEPSILESERIILTGSYGLPDTARVIIK